ncbi:MAG: TIGR02099 family protein [Hydrogenophilaceae bacterium]|nr:TIGR02099 family protein [Hydrogenophilaceae bacterium]
MNTLTRRLLRIAAWIALAGAIGFAGVMLTVKYVLLPRLSEQRVLVEQSISQAIGLPVRIGSLLADWRGMHPRLLLTEVSIQAANQEVPLTLPRVDATVSWSSLIFFEPRLAELSLRAPKLTLRRDKAGVIYVAGIPVNQAEAASDFPDWLLRQRLILVSDAEVTWLDEKIGAPPLKLSQLNAALHNLLGRHRLGLTALPPRDVATRLDLRGDLRGGSVRQPEDWSGQIYSRVDGVDLAAWNRQTPWAQETVQGGHGNLRFWVDIKNGALKQVVGDSQLHNITLQFAKDLRILAFRDLASRIVWQRSKKGGHAIHTEGLRFSTATGETSSAAKLSLQLEPDAKGLLKPTQAEAQGLRLEAVTALADAIPLPKNLRDLIENLSPRGFIDFAQAEQVDNNRYRLAARFHQVGVNAYGKLPGFSNLSGSVKTDQDGGEAQLDSQAVGLDYPSVFRNPLAFSDLHTRLKWQTPKEGGVAVDIDTLKVVNADLKGEAKGKLQLKPGQAAQVDIQVQLDHGEANAVWKYLPHPVADDAHAWLKQSLISGYSDDSRVTLKGALDKFPFDKGGGEFKASIRMRNGVLDYGPGWPRISNIQGLLVFHDKAMSLTTEPGAKILTTPLGKVTAHIPDLFYAQDEQLLLDGSAAGPTQGFFDFIHASPVFEHTGRFTESMQATGNGELALHLKLPLRRIADTTVGGSYRFHDNRIEPGLGLPTLDSASGQIDFTDKSVSGQHIKTLVFKQPAELTIASETGGRVRVDLRGRATAQALGEYLPANLARRLSGAANYRAQLSLKERKTTLRVESDLTGLASSLPPPFDKQAAAPMPLLITKADQSEAINLRYANLLAASLVPGDAGIKRATFRLGGGDTTLPAEGIALRGSLPYLNLDAWREFLPGKVQAKAATVNDVNVSFAELLVENRRFHNLNLQAKPLPRGWQVKLNGQELQGEASYLPAENGSPTRISGQFKKLDIPKAEGTAGRDAAASAEPQPAIDIRADRFGLENQDYGALTLRLDPLPRRWQVREFVLASPDGQIAATGELSYTAQRLTALNVTARTGNLGNLLGRLGYPNALKRGEGEASGQFTWPGGIEHFQLGKFNGDLRLKLKNGQFTKIDPGAAKLLGILSLQSLPKRITLDFRDVFTEGFAFDEISGDVVVDRGNAYLKGLSMDGPTAKVLMGGKIGLADETQLLRVTVTPRLEESLAVGAALIGGPIAGVGAYVASKVLKDPLGQATTFEYQVSGTWADPVVVKLAKAPAAKREEKP